MIKKVKYSKEFSSRLQKENVRYDMEITWDECLSLNEEDKRIREEITKQFAFKSDKENYEGFDGIQAYLFQFEDTLPKCQEETQKKYASFVKIKKVGAENDVEKCCDLETFLLNNGYSQNTK